MPSREDYERAIRAIWSQYTASSRRVEAFQTIAAYVAQLESRPLPDEVAEDVAAVDHALLILSDPELRDDVRPGEVCEQCPADAIAAFKRITRALRGEE